MTQGYLPFQYEIEPTKSGLTAFGGLPMFLELLQAMRLPQVISENVRVRDANGQGWMDSEVLTSLMMLNISGGEAVDDIALMEGDEGFARVLRWIENFGLPRKVRRELEKRWRKEKKRAVPSASSVFRYLLEFFDEEEEKKRETSTVKAFIPAANEHLQGLYRVNAAMLAFVQSRCPSRVATIDMDATLVESGKSEAKFCYKGFSSYQPLNSYWAEHQMIAHSEFRDGNVPAGYQQLRVFEETLSMMPGGIEQIFMRSDTAGYQWDLLKYCAEGKNERFGVVDFAVGCDVTKEFKIAVAGVCEEDWQTIYKTVDGKKKDTGQQWAEVCYVPNEIGKSKNGPEYRFLAIREPLKQQELPGVEQPQASLPFPTMELGEDKTPHKLFGVVTNRHEEDGEEIIHWLRARCGKSEEAHVIMKDDLAGGKMPSGKFGVNAAWWSIMIMSFNLVAIMKGVVLGGKWVNKRMKAVRYGFINVAGRVMKRGRQLYIRINKKHPAFEEFIAARQRIKDLAQAPDG